MLHQSMIDLYPSENLNALNLLSVAISRALASFWRYPYLDQS